MIKATLLALALLAALVVGAATHAAYTQRYCPTEDSCVADYRVGQWHVGEVTP